MTHVGLIYGGRSSEHEVSIRSARAVLGAFSPDRYRVTPLYIDRTGHWHVVAPDEALALADASPLPSVHFAPMRGAEAVGTAADGEAVAALGLDVAFPMLHGQNGEDGRVQGLLQTAGVPYVGPDVLGSAVCMDKEVAKRLLRDSGLPIVPFRVGRWGERPAWAEVTATLGVPLFVKPANSGSSVGTAKVEDEAGYAAALADAYRYDGKVLVERAIEGREIECAVLGNEEPRVAVPGEIVSTAAFYTYDAKYEDPDAARMQVPADLPEPVAERLRDLAVEAFRVLSCEGMARVDFFVTDAYDVFINEVNTIPGFTERSMYPVMWEASGLPLEALVDELVRLALARHARAARLATARPATAP
jgi:D-alanine-D-alanine ligase